MAVDMVLNGSQLVITVDMNAPGRLSSTGKKWLIASVSERLADFGNRTGIRVGLNVMCDEPVAPALAQPIPQRIPQGVSGNPQPRRPNGNAVAASGK